MPDKYTLVPATIAYGFVEIDGKSISLPGRFWMMEDKPGYWVNDVTGIEVFWRSGEN